MNKLPRSNKNPWETSHLHLMEASAAAGPWRLDLGEKKFGEFTGSSMGIEPRNIKYPSFPCDSWNLHREL